MKTIDYNIQKLSQSREIKGCSNIFSVLDRHLPVKQNKFWLYNAILLWTQKVGQQGGAYQNRRLIKNIKSKRLFGLFSSRWLCWQEDKIQKIIG